MLKNVAVPAAHRESPGKRIAQLQFQTGDLCTLCPMYGWGESPQERAPVRPKADGSHTTMTENTPL